MQTLHFCKSASVLFDFSEKIPNQLPWGLFSATGEFASFNLFYAVGNIFSYTTYPS